METKQSNLTEVSVQLLTSGKYKWTITTTFENKDVEEALQLVKKIDGRLKDQYPNYPMPGSGRVSQIDDE